VTRDNHLDRIMKALVLAAGLGERVRPLTDTIPKPMLPVGGRPLIDYPLMMLRRAGITQVIVNVHHLAGAIQKGLGRGERLGLDIVYAPEPVLLGTGGPLNAVRDYLGKDAFVIANSDGILDLDLSTMIEFHRDRGALATLALVKSPRTDAYIDADSRIRRMRLRRARTSGEFDDYPPALDASIERSLASYMYCGAIVAESAMLDLIPKSPPWSLMSGLFAPMVAQALPVFGFVHDGYFRTVDDLAAYEALRTEFESTPPRLRNLAS